MDFDAFERKVHAAFDEIPPEFRERVAGPVVVRRLKRGNGADEGLDGRVTLGECVHAPDITGSAELHSTVFLYYGSFRHVAAGDPSFDWDAEIVETVRHEVQHHVEDQVGHPGLRDEDFADEQNARRHAGLEFRSGFWRAGTIVPDPRWELRAVGEDVFLEVVLPTAEWDELHAKGRTFAVSGQDFVIAPGEVELDEEFFEFAEAAPAIPAASRGPAHSHGHTHGHAHPHAAADDDDNDDDAPRGDFVLVIRRRRSFLDAFWRRGR